MQISVIVPSYNRADFLINTTDTILAQSYQAKEIIIVDDGSTDDTAELVSDLQKSNPTIKYIYQDNNGVSSARNTGIVNATCDWIAFCDSDDLWLENKLKNQRDFLETNPRILFCHTNEIWKRGDKIIKQKSYHKKPSGFCFEKNLLNTIIGASTVVLHKSILDDIGLFDEELVACEDYDMWLRISRKYEIGLIEEAQIIKQAGHSGQLSFETPIMDKYRIMALQKHTQDVKYFEEVNSQLEKRVAIIQKGAIKHNNLSI